VREEDNAVAQTTRQPGLDLAKCHTPHPIRIAGFCLTLAVSGIAAGAQEVQQISRVRAENPVIATAVTQGLHQSTTFRRLIEAIEATDGLVYVLEGDCGLGVRACLHMSVELAGPNRLLRVFVNPKRAPGCELVASIGHELQHVLEALSNRRIRTTAELTSFFHRIRPNNPGRFETMKAIETGMAVEKEACNQPASRSQPAPGCAERPQEPDDQSASRPTSPESSHTAQGSPNRHVRGTEEWIDALVRQGIGNSPTFRCLVATLDQSDVIVHLQRILVRGGDVRGGLRGLLSFQIRAHGNYRYLRIGVGWQANEARLIGTVAHELQHAIEVARVPQVRTPEDLKRLFTRLSGRVPCGVGDCMETTEALDVQRAVMDELRQTDKDGPISNDRPPE
jgi:hypothetical protein